VVSLSLAASLDPALHLAAGRALAPLRDEGVLIVGSGMSFHNLRGYLRPETGARAGLRCMADEGRGVAGSGARSLLTGWREAPFAAYSHPREEHLIPLMVAAGAGGDAPGKRIFGDEPMGAAISAYRFERMRPAREPTKPAIKNEGRKMAMVAMTAPVQPRSR
jgi:aromatic ring-opening dioxygenase catalytic subunit (LigB family)